MPRRPRPGNCSSNRGIGLIENEELARIGAVRSVPHRQDRARQRPNRPSRIGIRLEIAGSLGHHKTAMPMAEIVVLGSLYMLTLKLVALKTFTCSRNIVSDARQLPLVQQPVPWSRTATESLAETRSGMKGSCALPAPVASGC